MADELIGGTQLDLFGLVEKGEVERAAWAAELERRMLDCCTGEPCPRSPKWIWVGTEQRCPEWDEPGYEPGLPRRRCGRCHELTTDYTSEHDSGYSGCHGQNKQLTGHPFTQLDRGGLNDRHDQLHHAPCARPGCGDAWGLHSVNTRGARYPEEMSCLAWCGCPGYVAPAPDDDWICRACRFPVQDRRPVGQIVHVVDHNGAGCTAPDPILRRDA